MSKVLSVEGCTDKKLSSPEFFQRKSLKKSHCYLISNLNLTCAKTWKNWFWEQSGQWIESGMQPWSNPNQFITYPSRVNVTYWFEKKQCAMCMLIESLHIGSLCRYAYTRTWREFFTPGFHTGPRMEFFRQTSCLMFQEAVLLSGRTSLVRMGEATVSGRFIVSTGTGHSIS